MADKPKKRKFPQRSQEEEAQTVIDLERPQFSDAPALSTELSDVFGEEDEESHTSDTLPVPRLPGFEDTDDEDTDLMSAEALRKFHSSAGERGSGPRPAAQGPSDRPAEPQLTRPKTRPRQAPLSVPVPMRIGDDDEHDTTHYRPRPLAEVHHEDNLADEATLSRPLIHRFEPPRSAQQPPAGAPGFDEPTLRRPPPEPVGSNFLADDSPNESDDGVPPEDDAFEGEVTATRKDSSQDDAELFSEASEGEFQSFSDATFVPNFVKETPTRRVAVGTDDVARSPTQLPNTVDPLGSSAEVDTMVVVIEAPHGATTFIDGQDRGSGRLTLTDLDPFGRYSLRIHKKGCVPFTMTLEPRGEPEVIIRPDLKARRD